MLTESSTTVLTLRYVARATPSTMFSNLIYSDYVLTTSYDVAGIMYAALGGGSHGRTGGAVAGTAGRHGDVPGTACRDGYMMIATSFSALKPSPRYDYPLNPPSTGSRPIRDVGK